MIDFFSLFKTTDVYKVLFNEKKYNKLSHAYLITTSDKYFLDEYLKLIAKLFVCEKDEPCLNCRKCKLIEQNVFSDVCFYPKNNTVKTEDISEIISESYIKPIECDKKIFIISHAETMNTVAQNKLLKTLEEPPENVYLLVGATDEFSLLPTIVSRMKKFEISRFEGETLFEILKEEYNDYEKLKFAIEAGDGTIGETVAFYNDPKLSETIMLATEILADMRHSKDILKYSDKIIASGVDIKEFLSGLAFVLREFLYLSEGKSELVKHESIVQIFKKAEGFNLGSIVYAEDKINEAFMRNNFNANKQMIIEWLLFQILEGKYKWRK